MPVLDLGLASYAQVQALQRRLRSAVIAGHLAGVLLLLEHHPVITLGARGSPSDLRCDHPCAAVPVVVSERGGAATLHAPGQLIAYPIMPLPQRNLRAYVWSLEEVLIEVLTHYSVPAIRYEGRPGVFAANRKIGSLGLRCERWVASHGTSLNVNPDLSLFDLIVSCGEPDLRQTSVFRETGDAPPMDEVKTCYTHAFAREFGLTLQKQARVAVDGVEATLGLGG
jgi:lipoyl(octanoyl) transferase